MIKKLYIKFGGGCYTARVSNEGVKTFDYKILLCKFEFTMMQIIQILLCFTTSYRSAGNVMRLVTKLVFLFIFEFMPKVTFVI